jgi:hypothetical protein
MRNSNLEKLLTDLRPGLLTQGGFIRTQVKSVLLGKVQDESRKRGLPHSSKSFKSPVTFQSYLKTSPIQNSTGNSWTRWRLACMQHSTKSVQKKSTVKLQGVLAVQVRCRSRICHFRGRTEKLEKVGASCMTAAVNSWTENTKVGCCAWLQKDIS